jgi:hypothetical protein
MKPVIKLVRNKDLIDQDEHWERMSKLFDQGLLAVVYNDAPRPKWWRHPVRWHKWKQPIIGFVDLGEDFSPLEGELTIEFGAD